MKAPLRAACRGFTLIEMILTLCIFLLLVGAVFNIFNATLQGVAGLQDDQARADQTEALRAWMSKSFLAVPAGGAVFSYRRENVPFDVTDLIWQSGSELQALDLAPQADGRYTLRVATVPASSAPTDFERAVLQDAPGLSWRPLVRDIVAADWRFRGDHDTVWRDSTAAGGQLELVQFTYRVAGSGQVAVDDCWIPPLVPVTDLALTSDVSPANP